MFYQLINSIAIDFYMFPCLDRNGLYVPSVYKFPIAIRFLQMHF